MISILQVENMRAAVWQPDPSLYPHIQFEHAGGNGTGISPHACEVLDFMVGPKSPAKDIISKVYFEEATWFYGEDVRPGNSIAARKALAPLANHSYGRTHITPASHPPSHQPIACFDARVERENTVEVVAINNDDNSWTPLWCEAENIVLVGDNGGSYSGPSKRSPHLVADHAFTSYCAPMVTAAAAVLIYEYVKRGIAYRWSGIRALLVAGATPMGDKTRFGAGMFNLAKSLELQAEAWKPAPSIPTPPAKVQCAAMTKAKKPTRCKRTVNSPATLCFQHD